MKNLALSAASLLKGDLRFDVEVNFRFPLSAGLPELVRVRSSGIPGWMVARARGAVDGTGQQDVLLGTSIAICVVALEHRYLEEKLSLSVKRLLLQTFQCYLMQEAKQEMAPKMRPMRKLPMRKPPMRKPVGAGAAQPQSLGAGAVSRA